MVLWIEIGWMTGALRWHLLWPLARRDAAPAPGHDIPSTRTSWPSSMRH